MTENRDQHAAWWAEFGRTQVELNEWLARDTDDYRKSTGRAGRLGDDDDEDYFALVERLSKLIDLVLLTPARTLEAAVTQSEVLLWDLRQIEADGEHVRAAESLRGFLLGMGLALERRGVRAEIDQALAA